MSGVLAFLLAPTASQQVPVNLPQSQADLWIGIAGLALTILFAGLSVAYRLGRNTQALDDLKQAVKAVETRVETVIMRGWVEAETMPKGRNARRED